MTIALALFVIALACGIAFVAVFMWALMRTASDADQAIERMHTAHDLIDWAVSQEFPDDAAEQIRREAWDKRR